MDHQASTNETDGDEKKKKKRVQPTRRWMDGRRKRRKRGKKRGKARGTRDADHVHDVHASAGNERTATARTATNTHPR